MQTFSLASINSLIKRLRVHSWIIRDNQINLKGSKELIWIEANIFKSRKKNFHLWLNKIRSDKNFFETQMLQIFSPNFFHKIWKENLLRTIKLTWKKFPLKANLSQKVSFCSAVKMQIIRMRLSFLRLENFDSLPKLTFDDQKSFFWNISRFFLLLIL